MHQEFTAELVIRAYGAGIFPMGHDDGIIRWYSPDPRCIIDLSKFHIPKRLMRTYRQGKFEMKINHDFRRVMELCAERDSTWITDDILDVYTELNQLGFAHSVEAYSGDYLAGGLYGVSLGGAFMGESMFHRLTDASKISLVYLVEHLKAQGFILLDSQYMTSHLSTFGAVEIRRSEYMKRLHQALELNCRFDTTAR